VVFEWLNRKSIYLYQKPLDFRKQLDGLAMIVATEMNTKPSDGAIYVFRNQRQDKIKVLTWDRNGFVLGYKRIEQGRFCFPVAENGVIQLTLEQLYLLISGLSFEQLRTLPKTAVRYLC